MASSSLSPLAPPFKVDKVILKPNLANTSVISSEVPIYGACFAPAPGHFWNSSLSSTSEPNCAATDAVAANLDCSFATNMYGYQEIPSSTSPTSVFYASNNVSTYDPFSYDQFPNTMNSSTKVATKSCYPQYIPPPPQKVGIEPGYDLLSHSGSAYLNGSGSAQVYPQQNMFDDGGHKSKWGYFGCELNDNERGKLTDFAQGFISKELSGSNLSSSKGSLFVDWSNQSQPFIDNNVRLFADRCNNNQFFDDMSDNRHLKQGACLTKDSGLYGEASAINVKDKSFDIFGGAYNLGSLGLEQQGCMASSERSTLGTSASASISKESLHIQEPVMEFGPIPAGSQKGNSSLPEDHFSHNGLFTFGCASTTTTYPIAMSKSPVGGSRFSAENTFSAAQPNSMGFNATDQSTAMPGYTSSYHTEMPVGLKRQSSIRIRRPAPSTAASSCHIGETVDNRLDDKASSESILFSPQLPHQICSDGLKMEASDSLSTKHSGGSDVHNTAEDSPCWKGASSNRFSPFGHSESVDSDAPKTIDKCRSLSPHNVKNNGPFSFGKLKKVTSLEKPSLSDCTSNDNEACDSVNPKSYRFDLNAEDIPQFADDCDTFMMESNMIKKSQAYADINSSLAAQTDVNEELSSGRDISEAPLSEKRGNGTPVVTEILSDLSLKTDINSSNPLPESKSSMKPADEDPDSRIDVNVLLRTMMNLSEIFQRYCFVNQAKVSEKQTVAIKQVISNLNASMLLLSGQTTPTRVLSSPDRVFQKDFPVVQMVNDAEMLTASFKDDGFPLEDANMTEALTKLISENFQEEETDKQKLLYKNLWLEAEASLCIMTAKARFLRMKTEMKRTHNGTKGNPTISNVPVDLELGTAEKDFSSRGERPKTTISGQHTHIKVVHDPNSEAANLFSSEDERSKSKSGFSDKNEDRHFITRVNQAAETCVLARCKIPKDRVGSSDSLNYEKKQSSNECNCPSHFSDISNGVHVSVSTTKANDVHTSVFGDYQILKGKDENSDQYEGQPSSEDENYLPGNGSSSTNKAFQDSEMSNPFGISDELKASVSGQTIAFQDFLNSLGVTNECEARIPARFYIQSRMDHSNSMSNGPVPGQTSEAGVENGIEDTGESRQKSNMKKATFEPYPESSHDGDVDCFNIGVNEQSAYAPIMKTNRMHTLVLEGWYGNECSSSDWEHISGRDL
ncbi:uncharacterized protein LOC130805914 isoform X2 [Amaranthus tricolor]|nr:uncharacterized protein LOC130805914 isoform X2 [Amaranthus tricolor]